MSETLETLQVRYQELQLADRVLSLEEQIREKELAAAYVVRESEWGATVDRTEYLKDTAAWQVDQRMSLPQDRKNGDNHPFWVTEQEHATIRGIARFIQQTDEIGIAALETVKNYTIGDGIEIQIKPKDEKSKTLLPVSKRCQELIDHFLDCNDWIGDGDRHAVERTHRDGELMIALQHRGGPDVEARFACPSFLTQPDDPRKLEDYLGLPSLDWKYGIATDWGNTQRRHGYFLQWFGDDNDWDFVPPTHMVYEKINTDREVKRGMSDYYAVYVNLERASKLLGNTLMGSAVQAAIAYIREHGAGVSGRQIEDFANRRSTSRTTVPTQTGGTATRRAKKIEPGTVIDTQAGVKYIAGPLGQQQRTSFIEIMQAALRVVGIRWTIPEYMISGDASNANFASTLVSESPFVKSAQARQGIHKRANEKLAWKVLGICCNAGLIPGWTLPKLKKVLTITVDVPQITTRDPLKENQSHKIEADAGILSLDTWATKAGYKLADEQAKGAKAAPPPAPAFGQPGQPPNGPPGEPGAPPVDPAPKPAVKPGASGQDPADPATTREHVLESIWRHYP